MASPKIFLITPDVADATGFAAKLGPLLSAAKIDAVLLCITGDEDAVMRAAKVLVPVVQEAGAAAILNAPADLRAVARSGADGAHFPVNAPALKDALEALKPARIVGIGGLRTKHEMMDAGETAIDYLMFGEPREDGSLPELERVVERVQWWAEIFNVPCVAYAADLASVPDLAATGADFVALGTWVFDSADPAQTLREAVNLVALAKNTK